MRRLLTLLPLLLVACGFVAPPRDAAQWTTTVHGIQITWRWVNPGTLGTAADGRPFAGYAHAWPLGEACVIDLDPSVAREHLTQVAAHEYGHCAQALYLRVGGDPGVSDPYHQQPLERWPEAYAQAYLRACGQSLRPLGWPDHTVPLCREAPRPHDVPATF